VKGAARKYTKRVGIYSVTDVEDGFGGVVSSAPTLVANRWCKVENVAKESAAQYRNDFGLKADARVLRFTFRQFKLDMDSQLLGYSGYHYAPLVEEYPDQYGVEAVIIAEQTTVIEGATQTNNLLLQNGDNRLLEGE